MHSSPSTPEDPLAARLLHQRIVVATGPLDDVAAARLCAELLLLASEDPRGAIALYLLTEGGPVPAGLAVHDTLRSLPNDVRTVALGRVVGTGALLLASGTPGRRHVMPHAQVRLGDAAASQEVRDLLDRYTSGHADPGTWLSAEQACAHGLADEVVADAPTGSRGPTIGIGARLTR